MNKSLKARLSILAVGLLYALIQLYLLPSVSSDKKVCIVATAFCLIPMLLQFLICGTLEKLGIPSNRRLFGLPIVPLAALAELAVMVCGIIVSLIPGMSLIIAIVICAAISLVGTGTVIFSITKINA
jgi:hypothetical protein